MTRREKREMVRCQVRHQVMIERLKAVIDLVIIILIIALIGLAGHITGDGETQGQVLEYHNHEYEEQRYIARYATSIDIDENGITTFEDTDGNMWKAQDAPTELGQQARLLFDSQYTTTVLDDEIIDIIEE